MLFEVFFYPIAVCIKHSLILLNLFILFFAGGSRSERTDPNESTLSINEVIINYSFNLEIRFN